MNAKLIVSTVLLIASIFLTRAGDGQAVASYERGLLEEEAHHELDAAIYNYRESLAYLITNRQMLASAVFRLGECYRKQGKLTEARLQYRRILRDFPDQTSLARTSQELVGSASNHPPAYVLSFGNSSVDPANNLAFPGGVAVDSSGNVYVSDTHHDRIRKFTAAGVYLSQWGSHGTKAGCFDYPQGLATDGNGHVYVADTHNNRIQEFNGDGSFVTQWGKYGSKPGEFHAPYSIALDAAGNLFVADAHNDRIQKFSASGGFMGQFGTNGSGPGQFDLPKSVAVDRAGNIYVADTRNKRVQKFTPEGTYLED